MKINNQEKKVAVAGCKHTTKDLILGLEGRGYKIDHCITIDPEKGEEQKVAGYMDLTPFLKEKGIPYTVAKKYSLKSEEDEKAILNLRLDMLLVMGWQRLIPDWLLNRLSVGAFGMHGSSKPLPHGRGRSPMNWSLIQGKTEFYTHLFQYLPGVDDGPIIGVQKFDINQYDTALTLHFKNTSAMIHLCSQHLPALFDGTATKTAQPTEGATYYPKRTAEDGIIHFTDSTTDVYNLIRAVTKPFPGAFCYLNDDKSQKIMIWRAQPFDTQIPYTGKPGEIIDVLYNGMFVVKTSDGTLLVTESEGYDFSKKDVGSTLGDLGQAKKQWENLPE